MLNFWGDGFGEIGLLGKATDGSRNESNEVQIGERDDNFLLRSMRRHSIERGFTRQQLSTEMDR